MGKTETIRQRAINVYLPTEEMIEKWKSEAERYGVPLSRFVVEVVDDAIRKNPAGMTPREQLEQELEKLRNDYRLSLERIRLIETSLAERDATVAEYRTELSKPKRPEVGDIAYMMGPVLAHFKENESLRMDDAYDMFGFSPSDSKKLRSLKASMGLLISNGLVEKGIDEWRWIGERRRKGRRSSGKR